jgi:hypothetical protein
MKTTREKKFSTFTSWNTLEHKTAVLMLHFVAALLVWRGVWCGRYLY